MIVKFDETRGYWPKSQPMPGLLKFWMVLVNNAVKSEVITISDGKYFNELVHKPIFLEESQIADLLFLLACGSPEPLIICQSHDDTELSIEFYNDYRE